MASTRRKSAAIALAIVGIAGLSLAAAAQLNVTSNELGAGVSLVSTCDDAVTVSYTNSVVAGEYVVDDVIVSGIDAVECAGQNIGITVAGVTPAEQTVSGATATFAVTGVAAADVVGVAVIIYE